ncbi:MAG: DUF502 domain-containing protein [Kiritimatiellae bacterium]|nr:DUF502 domain-containing protein [Kiritimatiellia bacterium]
MMHVAKSIRNNILVGLVLVTPIVITGFIINGIFRFATNRLLPAQFRGSEHELLFRAAAILAVLVILFLIGLLVRNFVGRRLYRFGDSVLTRIPVISKIYLSVRQISEALVAQRQTLFQDVVLVEYPRKGLYSVGFVTATVPDTVGRQLKAEGSPSSWVSVFIATTPNPTSGVLILAPRQDLIPLRISVADAMKLIISAGAAYPGEETMAHGPNLLESLESWLARDTKPGTPPPEADHGNTGGPG